MDMKLTPLWATIEFFSSNAEYTSWYTVVFTRHIGWVCAFALSIQSPVVGALGDFGRPGHIGGLLVKRVSNEHH